MNNSKISPHVRLIRKNSIYCCNCGKYGHYFNNCIDPLTSVGIICFKIDCDNDQITNPTQQLTNDNSIESGMQLMNNDKLTINQDDVNKIFNDLVENDGCLVKLKMKDGIKLTHTGDSSIKLSSEGVENSISVFASCFNRIKFLLIQRRYSLGYIIFMKGKWDSKHKDQLILLFQQMTQNEMIKLLESSKHETSSPSDQNLSGIEKLWKEFWTVSNKNQNINYKKFITLKKKFNELIHEPTWNLEYYCTSICEKKNSPEWGFPKGKREGVETNLQCAIREFKEETGNEQIIVLKKLYELREDMIGTDDVKYRHLYYVAYNNDDKWIPTIMPDKIDSHKTEIGNMGWYNYTDAMNLINEKHVEKQKILMQIYMFIISRIIKYKRNMSTITL
jgi:8-oxo-dGTP pyrophosphatase MutT (NUDIX family)